MKCRRCGEDVSSSHDLVWSLIGVWHKTCPRDRRVLLVGWSLLGGLVLGAFFLGMALNRMVP